MKRFYKQAAFAEAVDGFSVTLDGRPVRTPGRHLLCVPTHGLAEAIATEWADQPEQVRPQTMPIMRIAATALDRVGPEREGVVKAASAYAATDLLCYRAATPAELAARQAAVWQPLLDWAEITFAAPLVATSGISPVPQPPASLAALEEVVAGLDDFHLAALSTATAAAGSLVLGLALARGRLTAAEAFAASQVDEAFHAELWGEGPEAARARKELAADLDSAARCFALLAS